ncbi:MAG: Uma2 family endonuclease [Terriglobia bacterium]
MSTKTLLTVEQFERLPAPEVGSYELDQGELVYVSPNDLRHNRVRDRLYMPLREFVSRKGLGEATAETLFEFGHGTVRAPDVAYMAADQIRQISADGVLRLVPRLVVEVLSPGNTPEEMTRRIQLYKNAGVAAIWILDPAARNASIYKGSSVRTLSGDAVLSDPEIVPGFSISLPNLFD